MGVHKHFGFSADWLPGFQCDLVTLVGKGRLKKTVGFGGCPSSSLQVVSTSPGLKANAQEGSAEPLESFTFDRTGEEKGQAPGRQVNLMKFGTAYGNIGLVIKVGETSETVHEDSLPISLPPFPLRWPRQKPL